MKSHTDIIQSRKLAEILPVESADMCWCNNSIKGVSYTDEFSANLRTVKEVKDIFDSAFNEWDKYWKLIPCWSLVALLDIFPCSKESPIVNLTRGGWNPSFTRRWFATWEDENKNILYSCDGASPIDAVVELIMKLHEQKLL